jgi:hypothetical protein
MRLPRGYREPEMVYAVEWHDEEGRGLGQAGAFFSMETAEACLAELRSGAAKGELVINMIPVHSRIVDWRFDRQVTSGPRRHPPAHAAIRSATRLSP